MSNQKTPTTILLTPERRFHSFGYAARDFYHDLDPNEAKQWLYLEKFKMKLHTTGVSGPLRGPTSASLGPQVSSSPSGRRLSDPGTFRFPPSRSSCPFTLLHFRNNLEHMTLLGNTQPLRMCTWAGRCSEWSTTCLPWTLTSQSGHWLEHRPRGQDPLTCQEIPL